jgi:hypothetical protein
VRLRKEPCGVTDPVQPSSLPAIASVAISAAVAVVGFSQWWTARNKLRFDLFERRWKVYNGAYTLLVRIIMLAENPNSIPWANTLSEGVNEFKRDTYGAVFLFDKNLKHYLDDIVGRAEKLLSIFDVHRNARDSAVRVEAMIEINQLKSWAQAQVGERLNTRFSDFLLLDEGFFSWLCRKHGPRQDEEE